MKRSEAASILPPLERLIRAAVSGRTYEALKAYRDCYEIGPPLVSEIVEKVRSTDWRRLRSGEELRYFSCLMSLLHDIHESASRELADHILRRGCHPVVEVRLRSILDFTLRDFEARPYGPLTIYVSTAISSRDTVWRYLDKWLSHVPAEDLEGIDRLYVDLKDQLPGLWGSYLRVLSVVSLVWRPSCAWNWFAALHTELILYHEIGHHVDRRNPELREDREALADTYAQRLFRKVHPVLGNRFTEILLRPVHVHRKLRRARRIDEASRQVET